MWGWSSISWSEALPALAAFLSRQAWPHFEHDSFWPCQGLVGPGGVVVVRLGTGVLPGEWEGYTPPPPPGAYPQRARACCILNKHTRHRRQLHDGDAYIRLTRGCMQLISCRAQESLTRWRCSKANKSR